MFEGVYTVNGSSHNAPSLDDPRIHNEESNTHSKMIVSPGLPRRVMR